MSVAYVDTSVLVAILLKQPQAKDAYRMLQGHRRLISGNLLISELYCALRREDLPYAVSDSLLKAIAIIHPGELRVELVEVLGLGYLRSADTHHLATALWLAQDLRKDLYFLTLDETQKERAKALGLGT